ncbi:putative acyl-CoA dehydrogenase IBR3 [Neolecta irregularis DAH-3]|uniref:Putative acyl-CoA dehydrogenase IBR3 n=1 Tax=Neolecta irregularis (strain DAH-3) TaxID=1198029 RepID=A0A1U7LWC8_NEOID|nr:putative acyl-CoA dehydrogenase IBR3 [Neolecta irregularis DAH-3]|eukprot:OLL26986.1 putative acyl-CoA dehydrogenase IBR3 [Neolecta irregularis DAH-3]
MSQSIPNIISQKVRPQAREILQKVGDFVDNDCLPAEELFHAQIRTDERRWKEFPPVMEELKSKAKKLGLWNLFLHSHYKEGAGLTNVEYALMAEIMGRCPISSEAMNCSAPDTGNMEVFAKYGSEAQKQKWLTPLLTGDIRSAFAMTERFVASSDATNIQTSMVKEGNEYVINGQKWWISGAGDPRCAVYLVMGKTNPKHDNPYKQQSIIIVPAETPGVTILRPMHIFGFDDAPHGHMEMAFENCRVPAENLILGEGRGFEIIQGRLGPGRIHHCMRSIGVAERALDLMIARVTHPQRKTFGKFLYQHGKIVADIAKSRMEIDAARLVVLNAADKIDQQNAKAALREIAMAKVIVPNTTLNVIDCAMQSFGAEGICQDQILAEFWTGIRTLRYADGPDEVHTAQLGKIELRRAPELYATYRILH